jgi:hypothetical protein
LLKLSSPEPPHDIILTEPREHDLRLRELDAHLVSDKSRLTIGVGVLTLVGVLGVCGIVGIVVAEIYKAPTDVIERILLPTITGLIGVLGGLFVNGKSR